MKRTIIVIVSIAVAGAVAIYFSQFNKGVEIKISNKDDMITVTSPIKDSQISSPLSIAGRARGSWFFEGTFPIVLLDSLGNTIAEGHATAQGEWMTGDFVKYLGTLQFNNYIKGSKGTLVLKKDNPSGIAENDMSISVPIIFK